MIKTRLFTRREIIDIWSKQSNEKLDSKVCPMCRNILDKKNGVYFCNNLDCLGYREGFEEIKDE